MITYLDLHAVELYGWDSSKGLSETRKINNYRELIRSGSEAPPVHVCEIGIGKYTLDYYHIESGRPDGGHKRAKAYYLEGRQLPAILSGSCFAVPLERRVLVSEMQLIE